MGYIKHNAIVITYWDDKKLDNIRTKCCNIINKEFAAEIGDLDVSVGRDFASNMVTPILQAKVNSYYTFFIGPDGSKEEWGASDCGDRSREKIVKLLAQTGCDFAEISYGDEAGGARILNES